MAHKLKKLMATGLSGVAFYKAFQQLNQFRHPLKAFNPKERLLPEYDGHLEIDWLQEDQFEEEWEENLIPYLEERLETGRLDVAGASLDYHFYSVAQPQASLVIVHGFNEFKEQYGEVIYYLLQANIQVLIYDARGHGHSKSSTHQTMIDIEDFMLYLSDLDQIVQLTKEKMGHETPLWLLGHSMGGAVVTGYAQRHPQAIDGLILSAPMMAIQTGGVSDHWLHLFANQAQKFGFGKHYIPTITEKDAAKRLNYQPDNIICNSDVRGSFYHRLNYQEHQYPTFSGSINWLNSALDFLQVINQPDRIRSMTLPVLLLRAENDQIVRADGLSNLGYYLPNSLNLLVPGSQHTILSGKDQQVQAAISQIVTFIERQH